MYRSALTLMVCVAAAFTAGAFAQDEDATVFTFGEYYECDQTRETTADLLMEHVFAPVYDKHVEAGHLTGWTWLSHNAGGHWRRLMTYSAADLDTLLSTRDAMLEEFQAMGDQGREFTSICFRHDDLVWTQIAGNDATSTPAGSYATYYICDAARQERADEIVEELIGPAIDVVIGEGKLDGWFWSAHVIGGRYRRLMAHQGQSHAAMIEAVNEYNAAASETNEALANEFTEICNSHVDYLWDIVLPRPDADG